MFRIDTADYMMSICGNDALRELSSPGKSGSVFFLSQDDRFMIKTLRKSEVKVQSPIWNSLIVLLRVPWCLSSAGNHVLNTTHVGLLNFYYFFLVSGARLVERCGRTTIFTRQEDIILFIHLVSRSQQLPWEANWNNKNVDGKYKWN